MMAIGSRLHILNANVQQDSAMDDEVPSASQQCYTSSRISVTAWLVSALAIDHF